MSKTENYNEMLNESKEYVNTLLEELPKAIEQVKVLRSSDNKSENQDGTKEATNTNDNTKSSETNEVEKIAKNIEKTIDSFKKIPLEIKEVDGKPVQTVAFCGPAKSGKSSIFNLMSGFNTKTGYDISTMSSLAIIPNKKDREYSDEKLISESEKNFPNFVIKKLGSSEDVIRKGELDNRLFVSSYNAEDENSPINVVLLDLPDFDSIFEANWEKAKLGINRADTVIFTVSNVKYRSDSVFKILKEVLSKAGSFVYLLTQVDPEDDDFKACAEKIRNNLLEDVRNNTEFTETKNADGKSLAELLETCPFYYSPLRSRTPNNKIQIHKLENCLSDFKEMLFTGDVEAIYESKLKKMQYSSGQAIKNCDNLQFIVEKQQLFLNDIDNIVKQTAEKIIDVDNAWPLPYVLTILREELNKYRPKPLLKVEEYISKIIILVPKILKEAKNSIGDLLNKTAIWKNKDDTESKIEREANNCIKDICLNKNIPENLKHNSIEINEFVQEAMRSTEPPYLGGWKDEVRADINNWIKEQETEQIKRDSEATKSDEEAVSYGIIERGSGFKFRLKQFGYYALLPFKKIYDLVINITRWLKTRNRLEWLKIINQFGDILLPTGVLLIILDCFVDGGLGQLGLITLIGACPALTGALTNYLMQIIGAIGLGDIANKAKESWEKRSIEACKNYILENLIKPNILNYCMSKEDIEKCLSNITKSKEACVNLLNCLNNKGEN